MPEASVPIQTRIHRRRTNAPGAFTLVELLVVIGIIAVLGSLLLPMLQRARRQAVKLNCVSNMRQQGLAIFMYVNDNHGSFPIGAPVDGNYAGSLAFETSQCLLLIDRYTNGNGTVWCCPEYNRQGVWPTSPAAFHYYAVNYGGGYAHSLPCFCTGVQYGGRLILSDPNDSPYDGIGGWSSTSPYFKHHLPLEPDLAPPSMTPFLVKHNRLDRVRGHWMIRSEYYPPKTINPDLDYVAGTRHLGRDGLPEGGSVLFNDGSAVWSRRISWWPANGVPGVSWPESVSRSGAF